MNSNTLNPDIILATNNQGKVAELYKLLENFEFSSKSGQKKPVQISTMADFSITSPQETGTTFAQNALLKARNIAIKTGHLAIADDSGLAVDILGGSPGIFSARWAGANDSENKDRDNYELLLKQLEDVPHKNRQAQFKCAVALVSPDGREYVEEAQMPGYLLTAPRGKNGFGYDPIFYATEVEGNDSNNPSQGRSNAQLESKEKNYNSHRGKAFQKIIPYVEKMLNQQECSGV